MRKRQFVFLLTILLLFANTATGYASNTFKNVGPIHSTKSEKVNACYKSNNTKKHVVNVAVTTLWTEPNKTRAVDNPSLTNPVDLSTWTKDMSHQQKLWLLGKIDSQALYGQEITILESKGDWHKIAIKDQFSPKNSNGYPGWVPKSHVTEYYPNYENCNIAIVSSNKTNLYNSTATTSKFLEVSFNTILPVLKEEKDWIQVQTPNSGLKYMRKQDVNIVTTYKKIPIPTQQDLIDTSKKFIDLPYLWAGNSGYGFDCSGFTYSIYKQHGILIPRDSTVQAKQGVAVSKSNLQPGDLLFFAYNKGKGKVHHVAMYIGDGKMIHAPNYSRPVETVSMNIEPYKSEYAGARRYLK